MKTIISLFFAVMVSGCAGLGTGNPYLQNTATTAATVVPAALCYQKWGVWGAFFCGYGGNQLSKAAQYDPNQPQEEVVYVRAGGLGQYQDPYGSDEICDRTPPGGMNPLDPGMCRDPRGGGVVSRRSLVNNPLYACCNKLGGGPVPQATKVATETSQNLWERPEKRKQQEASKKSASGITIDNYLEKGRVSSQCQTGNHGVDGNCLRKLIIPLRDAQLACEKDSSSAICSKNPGKMAGIYVSLSRELISLQKEEMGDAISFKN